MDLTWILPVPCLWSPEEVEIVLILTDGRARIWVATVLCWAAGSHQNLGLVRQKSSPCVGVELDVESPFASQPPEGRVPHSRSGVSPLGWEEETLYLMISQLACQHTHLHAQPSGFILDSKTPNLSNNPGEKFTSLCLSNETLLIRYKSYGMKSSTISG